MKISTRTKDALIGASTGLVLSGAIIGAALLFTQDETAQAAPAPTPTVTVTAISPVPAGVAPLACKQAAEELSALVWDLNSQLIGPFANDAFNGVVSSTDYYLDTSQPLTRRFVVIEATSLRECKEDQP